METHTLSVVELNARISDALTTAFGDQVWVQGEIHGLSRSPAGHVYFKLVQPGTLGQPSEASISVVLFKGSRAAIEKMLAGVGGVTLDDDLEVRIRGEVVYYAPQGRVQLRMTALDPSYTLGKLAADRERLLRVLATEGLIGRNRVLPLPPVPLRIGLVTSVDSAAAHDVLAELARCGVAWHVQVIDTRVQGAEAVDSICAALKVTADLDLDVIALVRGGGSRTDLVAFDSEAVARAIATSPLPVLTGIGHEIDESVADLVAHRSFKTPTACAAFLCETVTAYLGRCEDAWAALSRRCFEVLDRHEATLRSSAARVATGARTTVELAGARVERYSRSLVREPFGVLDRADRALTALQQQVRALDPERVLARGWSITRLVDGTVLRSVEQAQIATPLVTTLQDGALTSTITAVRRRGSEGEMDG